MTFFFLPTAAVDKCCIDHWAQPRMGYKNTLKVNKHFSENKLTTAPRHHRFQFLRVTLSYESSNRWQNKLQPSSGSGHKILPYMRAGAWSQLCPLKMQNWDAHSQLKKRAETFIQEAWPQLQTYVNTVYREETRVHTGLKTIVLLHSKCCHYGNKYTLNRDLRLIESCKHAV